ncbi:hypothetical protein CAPTEDRAFT_200997 [Capitella teleta]|uniref:DUF4371 domain-containing protein n=1 Tax=Capitella teleta TaxID=283909 RepID=R7TL04_CAPTE|nr:hypothetical protein CAPTEDRAFT_200997 [Capitella teleta]|eukprot:ELT94202.1 hypothetical protein CAPTEDRAFT_200997 [Capitella teleta]
MNGWTTTRTMILFYVNFASYHKWKDVHQGLKFHANSQAHIEATAIIAKSGKHDTTSEALTKACAKETEEKRACLIMVVTSLRFLARQAEAIRRISDNGNLTHLLKLRSNEFPLIVTWMEKKSNSFTSPQVQNELMNIMACQAMDETTDVVNMEQVAMCLRWLDSSLQLQELDFIGLSAPGE